MNAKRNPFVARLAFSLAIGLLALLVVLVLRGRALAEDEASATKHDPDFTLKDTDGRVVKLADFAGKTLIVSFVVTWDEPSREQIKILSELLKEQGDKELVILAMAIEQAGQPTTKAYVEQEHPSFPFLVANYETIRAFGGVTAVPTTFVIDKERKIIRQHVGVTGLKVFEAALKPDSPQ
jgi:peroxiredoxin